MAEKIFIDPGHDGISDPGAIGNGLRESDLALKIAKYTAEYLKENYDGHETRSSRSGNTDLSLDDRTNAANKWGADIFVSVHLNASAEHKAKGFETFVYSSPNEQGISLQNILHQEILSSMNKFGSIVDRGKKRANYHVLRESKMNAILTETLFIDNKSDSIHLKNEAFLKAVGQAHAIGVAKFLGLPGKVAAQVANKPDYVGHPAENSIKKAIKTGVINGYDENTFKPDEPVTNARLAAILDRLGLLK